MASEKDAGLYLRLSRTEKALFQKTTQSYNITVSHMIRRLVLAVEAQAQLVKPELSETMGDLCRQLHAIGVNLTQLTRAVQYNRYVLSASCLSVSWTRIHQTASWVS